MWWMRAIASVDSIVSRVASAAANAALAKKNEPVKKTRSAAGRSASRASVAESGWPLAMAFE